LLPFDDSERRHKRRGLFGLGPLLAGIAMFATACYQLVVELRAARG
jgi:hypothetical protein